MKKHIHLLAFTIGTPITLGLALFLLLSTSHLQVTPPTPSVLSSSTQIAASSPLILPVINIQIESQDARPIIIKNYLHRYSSPLEPFANYLVTAADKYNLDYRLLPAIAQQESNLCKKIPINSHNCWGFGIYGDLVTRFDSYPQAIDTVARTLKRDYLDRGLDTPEKIMARYTPPSLEKGGPWAKSVTLFLSALE